MPKKSATSEERHRRDATAFMQSAQARVTSGPDATLPVDIRPSAIAAATGIERTAVSKIVSGARLPTYEQMGVLAEYLGVPAHPRPAGGPVAGPVGPMLPFALAVGSASEVGATERDLSNEALAAASPSLAEYVRGRGAARGITRRERYYLANTRVRVEPWVPIDPRFWDRLLTFWRGFLEEADQATEMTAAGASLVEAAAETLTDTVSSPDDPARNSSASAL